MRRIALLLLFLVATAFAWPAAAQDFPGRVGRLAWTEGTVALYQDADRGWDAAYLNSPLTSRNSVWTEPGARAEVQVGAMALRLDSATQLDIARLDDTAFDASLEQGEMAVRIRHLSGGDLVRVATPQASFLLQAAGRYRLESDPDNGESRLAVFAGTARLEGGNVRVGAGQSVVVWGGDHASYALQDAYATDFDRWAMARDEHWVESRAPTYVSYEMTGYEDLDSYGSWSNDPTYGAVWYPTSVATDWAPYREGRWAYVSPWGWTWIDAEPWGYAPFHYGRWVQVRDRWAWCPGKRVERPAWAPALVGFIGGATIAASTGPVVGWYPLAPSEPYRPWYSANRSYVTRVNSAVVTVPQSVATQHREWNRDHGATVVHRDALLAQRPVAQARVQVPSNALRTAQAAAAPTQVLPSRTEVQQAHQREGRNDTRSLGPRTPERTQVARGAPAAPANGNAIARPRFVRPTATPQAAPKGATPPPANAPLARATPQREREPQPRQDAQRQQQERSAQAQHQRQQDVQRQKQEHDAQAQRQQQQQDAQRQKQEHDAQAQRQQQDAQRQKQEHDAQAQRQQQQQDAQRQKQERDAQAQHQQQQQDAQRQKQERDAQAQRQQQQQEAQRQQQERTAQTKEREQQAQRQQQQAQRQQQERVAQEQQRQAREQQQKAQEQQQKAQEQQRQAQQQQRAQQAQQAQQQQQAPQAQQQQRAQQAQAQQAQQRAEQARQHEEHSQARAEPDRNGRDKDHGAGG